MSSPQKDTLNNNSNNKNENIILIENSNKKSEEEKLKNEMQLPEPQVQGFPLPNLKDSKWFFENIINKLSQKKSQTISVSIFIFLKENNYKPMSMQSLLDKLSEKFQKDPRTILKYKTLKDHFINELQIKNGFYAAIRENMGLKKTTINNIDYIGVDFTGTIEYFRNLKIRHASQGILDEEDIRFLFPGIRELTLTGKKRLRKYYPSSTRQKRHKKINFGLDMGDFSMTSKGSGKKQKRNLIYEQEDDEESNDEDNNYEFQNDYENNIQGRITINDKNINSINYKYAYLNKGNISEKNENDINNINVSLIINSINPFKDEELIKEMPLMIKDIKSKIKEINSFSDEVQNAVGKLGNLIKNKIKIEKEKIKEQEEKMNIKERKDENININEKKEINEKNGEVFSFYEKNKNILEKTYLNLEHEIKNIKNLEKYKDKYKNEALIGGHKKLINEYSYIFTNSLNKLFEILIKNENVKLDKEENDLLNKINEINSNLNEKSFYFEDLNKFLNDYRNKESNFNLKKIQIEEIKNFYLSKKNDLLKEIGNNNK